MPRINASVGNKAANLVSDVKCVQTLINSKIQLLSPHLKLRVDGKCGPLTIGLISEFQTRILKMLKPDGRVDPGKKTFKGLTGETTLQKPPATKPNHLLITAQLIRAQPSEASKTSVTKLAESDYVKAAIILGAETAAIKAIAETESRGDGFLANGKPKILFEGHWFSKLTNGMYDKTNPTLSYPDWTKTHYLGNEKEYSRLTNAIGLNREAALKSTSWGKFQIMGFNYRHCGYSCVEDYVKDMYKSEHYHLMAFVKFIKSMKWDADIKAKNWSGFAKKYNGSAYKKNNYDLKIKQAYDAFSKG